MRNFFAISVAFALPVAGRCETVKVFFDGVQEDLREPPVLRNGRALLGLRETFDRLGAVVYYDSSTRRITAWRAERTIEITIGRGEAIVDGNSVHLDQPPIIEGNTTYVPLRFIGEALGAGVKYVGSRNSVYIDTKAMGFFDEKAPFEAGDEVLYLYRREWHPAKILGVTDHPKSEDVYKIEFKEPSGRVIRPSVGRRYLRTAQ